MKKVSSMDDFSSERDPLLDVFIFETNQLLEQLEDIMLEVEKDDTISEEHINEIFRIMEKRLIFLNLSV